MGGDLSPFCFVTVVSEYRRSCFLAFFTAMPGKRGESTAAKQQDISIEKPIETSDETKSKEIQGDAGENKHLEKRSRHGRPKKNEEEDQEQAAKTPKREKKVKKFTPPSRTSRRLSNQKTGEKLPDFVEEEKAPKKRNLKTKRTPNDEEEMNADVPSRNP